MQGKSGVSALAPDRLLLDAGAVYLNYVDEENLGTLVGATRGGNEWNLNRTLKEIEFDGKMGSTKDMKRREIVEPALTVNLLEITKQNLADAIAGVLGAQKQALAQVFSLDGGLIKILAVEGEAYEGATGNDVTVLFEDTGSGGLAVSINVSDELIIDFGGLASITTESVVTAINAEFTEFKAEEIIEGTYTVVDDIETEVSFRYGQDEDNVLKGRGLQNGDYITNVTYLGMTSSGKIVRVTLKNCLGNGDWSVNPQDKDEAVLPVTFNAHMDFTNKDADGNFIEPWEIEFI